MKESFKKKAWVIFLVMLSVAGTGQAQVDSTNIGNTDISDCQSTWTRYSTIKDSSSLVRSNSRNHVVHTQYKYKATGMMLHTFIVKTSTLGPETAITTYFNAIDSTSYYVVIDDMRLFEDTCYFCGRIVFSYVYSTGEYVTHGIVGRFVPREIENGTGSLTYYEVKETSQLTRLAIIKDNMGQLLISAIGNKVRSTTPCLVEITPSSVVPFWNLRLDTIEMPDIILFSDIITVSDSLTLLSQFECTNDYPYGHSNYDSSHQVFLLDRFSAKGCYATYNSSSVYYMAHYEMPIPENCSFHYNKAPMRLAHINDQNKQFGVSFGVKEINGNSEGIRIFPFQHAWRYDSCIYYRLGNHVEVKEIGNLYRTANLFVLSRDNTYTNGILTYPELGFATHNVTRLYAPSYTLNSFTQQFTGNYISVTGYDNSNVFHLFDQDAYRLSLPSCFEKSTQQYDVLPGRDAARLVVRWGFSKQNIFEWSEASVFYFDLEKKTICEACI